MRSSRAASQIVMLVQRSWDCPSEVRRGIDMEDESLRDWAEKKSKEMKKVAKGMIVLTIIFVVAIIAAVILI